MNIGIISTSRIAIRGHVPALHALSGINFWSVFSRDIDRARTFAQEHRSVSQNPAFNDLSAFLSDPDLDAVIVTSADKLHADHVVACAAAGKHVLVEKPFATDLESGQRAVDACRAANVVLGVGYHLRWHPGHRALRNGIQKGDIGKIEHIRLLYPWRAVDASNWRVQDDVGRWWSLAGTGTHCLDLLRWFGDQPFANVTKRTSVIRSGTWTNNRDETAILSFAYENGMTAEITSSVLLDAPSRFEIFGSDGYGVCDATVGDLGAGRVEVSGSPLEFTPSSPFMGEIQDFVDAIQQRREPEVNGEMGLENVKEILLATS